MIKVDSDLNFQAGIDGGIDYYVIETYRFPDSDKVCYLRWLTTNLPGGTSTGLDGAMKFATASAACDYLKNASGAFNFNDVKLVRATWTHCSLHYYFPFRGPAAGPLSRLPDQPNRWPHLIVARHFALAETSPEEQSLLDALMQQTQQAWQAQQELRREKKNQTV